jgi:DNA-directed RNA polymerase subunit alpha
MCHLAEGDRITGVQMFERAVALDPGHTNALFQLGHANDLAGNDEEAISCYERCLKHPPIHIGTLINLGVLYEDHEKYKEALDCYRKVLSTNPTDEEARLFEKDAKHSLTMYYSPEEEREQSAHQQVLDIPVTDFELSVRARNCLKKMNIRTLGDLTRVSEQQLLSSKNFGETSLQEIKEMLAAKGLRLGQSIQDGAQGEVRYRPSTPVSEEQAAVLNKPVADLNLSVRARKCMNRLGINTLAQRTSARRRCKRSRTNSRSTACACATSDANSLRPADDRRHSSTRAARHASWPCRDAHVHARRHSGHGQGLDARAPGGNRRTYPAGQHLSPGPSAWG